MPSIGDSLADKAMMRYSRSQSSVRVDEETYAPTMAAARAQLGTEMRAAVQSDIKDHERQLARISAWSKVAEPVLGKQTTQALTGSLALGYIYKVSLAVAQHYNNTLFILINSLPRDIEAGLGERTRLLLLGIALRVRSLRLVDSDSSAPGGPLDRK